jgi:predicted DNA-binding ribbon-helix-helix protein
MDNKQITIDIENLEFEIVPSKLPVVKSGRESKHVKIIEKVIFTANKMAPKTEISVPLQIFKVDEKEVKSNSISSMLRKQLNRYSETQAKNGQKDVVFTTRIIKNADGVETHIKVLRIS